jgi:hypothetical protein
MEGRMEIFIKEEEVKARDNGTELFIMEEVKADILRGLQ